MRVLAIRGRNLASLEGDFAVDFEAEPLASAGIFAITGPTGAGKSTLLDAMCLALFNRIPRLASATAGQVGMEGGEAISTGDPRAVLRHRAGEGYAEVDFIGRDKVRYRARWTVQRAYKRANGALQKVTLELTKLDTNDRIGGGLKETLEAIRERVGLTADQFVRAVMLAQGDFDAFVRADANDRAALLEKLTGTEIYARLGRAAYVKASGLRAEFQLLEQRIADHQGLDDVARAEAEARLAEAHAALADVTERLAGLEHDRQWHATASALARQLAEAQAGLEAAQGAEAEAAPRREALRRRREAFGYVVEWRAVGEARDKAARQAAQVAVEGEVQAQGERDCAQSAERAAGEAFAEAEAALATARPALEQARALDRDLAQAQADLAPLQNARAEQAAALDRAEQAWRQAEATRAAGEAALATLSDWLAAHEARRALALREAALTADLHEHGALAEQALRVGEEAKRAGVQVAATAEARRAAEQAAATKGEALTEAQARLSAAEAAAPSAGAHEAASATRDALAGIEPLLGEAMRCAERAEQAGATIARIETGLTEAREAVARDRASAEAKDAELPLLRARRDEAQRAFALSAAASEDAAGRLRQALMPGEPCPVCGARAHDAALAALIDARATEDQARFAELDGQVQHTEREAAVLADRIREAVARIAGQERERAQLADDLARAGGARGRAITALAAAAKAVGLALTDDLGIFQDTLSARLSAADEARRTMGAARQALDEARTEVDRLRAHRDAAETARAQAAETERAALAAQAELTRRSADLTDRLQRLGAELDRELAGQLDWRLAGDAGAQLGRLVAEWRAREADHAACQAAQPGLVAGVHAADLQRTEARKALEQAEAAAAGLAARRHQLSDQRATLLGGGATEAVAARLEGAVQAAAATRETARQAAATAAQALSAAHATLAAARAAQADAETDATSRATALDARLSAVSLTHEAVAAEAAAGEGALAAEAEALAAIDEAVTRAEAEQAARARDHAAHLATPAPGLAPEALAEAIAGAEAEQGTAREAEGEALLVIRSDDNARVATEAFRAELSAKRASADVWLQLDQLIGDATGAKFRRFAQGLTLDRLLLHANARLAELKPRYEFQRGTGGDMLIQVVDHDMAGEVRGLHNLSGGERFLVSLALALGLSEMSAGQGLHIESLFIDEGFGALDSASLGAALAMLEQLHATGRRVGVISHIEEVKERVPVKIAVTPVARGRSRIEVLAE